MSMTAETSNARGEWVLALVEAAEAATEQVLHDGMSSRAACDQLIAATTNARAMLDATAPPAAARGDVPYDRVLIARMLEAARRGSLHQFSVESIEGAITALREADNAAVANVGTARLAAEGVQAGEVEQTEAKPAVMQFTLGEAIALVEAFGGENTTMSVQEWEATPRPGDEEDPRAGKHAWCAEYPDEGAVWLGEHDPDTEAYRGFALSQQPEARGVVDGEVKFNAAFFVSRSGNRIEQLTTYEDYHREGALLALMDLGQKRASSRGLTKKNAGKVTLAWVTAPQIVEGERNG